MTDRIKRALEQTEFKGIKFADVILDRIVDINWHEWDLSAEDPVRYPAGGEPENYILGRKHNERIAAQMPTLWALDVPRVANPLALATFDEEGLDADIDIFVSAGDFYVMPNLMNWIKANVPECATFSYPLCLLEPKKPQELMRHFKVRADIERGGEHENWGPSEWYLEIDDEDEVARQIQCYGNGNSLKYPGQAGMQIEDGHGGLGEASVDAKTRNENGFVEISQEEFERVWKASGYIDGKRQWSFDELCDELA